MDLQKYNNEIRQRLGELEHIYGKKLSKVNTWGKQTSILLFTFARNGKMIRSSLLLQAHEYFANNENALDLLDLACSLELIQSGLLIHDDIMDQDLLRRGNPTLHKQLETHVSNPRAAENLAICVGDNAFFIALELAGRYGPEITQKISEEISFVTVGQMQDISPLEETQSSILQTYRFKTGRYTFSLPLVLAAILSGQTYKTQKTLELVGENLGILFQIQDDYLGIFGESTKTGKHHVSDIQQNKPTLYKMLLQKADNKIVQEKILPIFGTQNISQKEILMIQDALKDSGVLKEVEKLSDKFQQETETEIQNLGNKKIQEFLRKTMRYVTERKS